MLAICVGEMGMGVEEFYSLRDFELDAIVRGHRKAWLDEWKRVQFSAYATVQSHSSKKVTPEQVLPLEDISKTIYGEDEKHNEEPEITPEDRQRILADADEFARRLTAKANNGQPINTEIIDISNPLNNHGG